MVSTWQSPPPLPAPYPTPTTGGQRPGSRLRASLRAPIRNPYDQFTAKEFDNWIGDITGSRRVRARTQQQ